jgi:hypothetical protein
VVNLEGARVVGTSDPVGAFTRETMQLGGRILASWTDGGALASAETHYTRHVFAWSPERGAEHHAVVPYALRASAVLVKRGDRSEWRATDRFVEEWLRTHPALSAVGPRLSFTHVPGAPTGAWFLQLRPIGDSRGHLALRPGDGGVSELLALIEHLRVHIPRSPGEGSSFVVEPAFGASAARALGALGPRPTRPTEAGERDEAEHAQRVTAALHLFACGRYKEAISVWKSIARDTPDRDQRWRALEQVGWSYEALEDYDRAVHFYELALAEGAPPGEVGEELSRARRKLD